ncbi:MAG: amidase domain-containing protein [Caldiserica bacterium]|nr:amidase domain-containing protein [Caldisericota bacterium]
MRRKLSSFGKALVPVTAGKVSTVFLLVVVLMLSFCTFPISLSASEAPNLVPLTSDDLALYQLKVQSYITDWVRNYYSRYYRVNYIDTTVESLQVRSEQIEALAKVHLNKVLKAKNVEGLPFVQGMLQAIGLTSYNYQEGQEEKEHLILVANPKFPTEKTEEIIKALDDRYNELTSYIGVADDSYMNLKIEAKLKGNEYENVKLYLQQQDGYVPAENMLPGSAEEMEKEGFSFMNSLLGAQALVAPSLYPGYDRIKARDYANTWTSNSTELCPHGLAYRTISYWNNSKWPYFSNACHADCADYVSQALNAGGIPVDPGQWERLRDGGNNWAWTSVPGLKTYMITQKGYWRASTWASASAGGVIVIPNYHVMMIVKNDTVERLYSAHTDDKKQCPYSNHTDWEYYILW